MSRTRGSFGSYARTFRAIFITAALLACGDSSSNPVGPGGGNNGGVAQISITPSEPTVILGAQLALQAQVRDANGVQITGASVFWSSADTTVVTISSAGVVTGKGVGSAQVAASSGGQSARTIVTVTSAPVASVSVLPATATLVVGGTTLLKAVTYDANQQVLTGRTVVWASSATQVASVDATGNVIGVSAGTATITATSEGKTASATITVTVIPIAAIAIAPGSAALTVGQSTSLTAIATDANGNVLGGRPMTWKSADPTIADVSTLGLVTAIAPGTTTVSATAEGKTGVAQIVVTSTTPIPVASVAVNPTSATLIVGGTTTISATVRDANGATLSGRTITWTSSAPTIATVSSSGEVTAVAIGTANITATCEGKSGTTAVTVSAVPVASVSVTPTSATLLVGGSTTLTAVTKDAGGNVLAGRTVTWTSSAPSIASVSSAGVVTGVAAGNATITATSEGKSTDTPVSVALAPVATITLTPTSASLVVGNATTITAVLKDAGGNVLTGRTIAWSSSVPGVATVDVNGVVTAVSAGTATIIATSEGKTASATITVSLIPVASVTTNPTSANLLVGGTLAMSAITKDANGNVLAGRVVAWSTSAPSVATVNASTGLVTAVGAGNATITATSEGKTGSASIVVALVPVATVTVNPSTATIIEGQTKTLAAITKDGNGNTLTGRTVLWTTSNSSVATVDASTGLVKAIAVGTATITATSETKPGTATITVVPVPVAAVTVSPTSAGLQIGGQVTIIATAVDSIGGALSGRTITFASDAPSIASVDPASGVVTALAAGTANIRATSEGKTSSPVPVTIASVASVTLSATSVNLVVGTTTSLTATPKDAGGNPLTGRVITWATDNPSVATVNASTGLITAIAAGTANISATSETKTSAPAVVTVTNVPVATVDLSPTSANLVVGATTSLTATPKDAGGNPLSGRTITWASDAPSIATVDASTGLITAIAAGTANITATSETKTSAPAVVTVTNVPVATVDLSPTSANLVVGATTSLTATPKDAGGNPLSGRTITWASDAPSIATVDASTGLITAIAAGTANITATSETKTSAPAVVTVTNVPVATVEVTPANPSLSAAISETVSLTATPKDGSGNTLSLSGRTLTWSSVTPSVATVDPSTGVVTAVAQGTATITATVDGVPGSTIVTVNP